MAVTIRSWVLDPQRSPSEVKADVDCHARPRGVAHHVCYRLVEGHSKCVFGSVTQMLSSAFDRQRDTYP